MEEMVKMVHDSGVKGEKGDKGNRIHGNVGPPGPSGPRVAGATYIRWGPVQFGSSLLQGVEYHPSINRHLTDHNVPCAVCYTPTQATMVMTPAWIDCPTSWTQEYVGYLMEQSLYSTCLC